MSCDYVLCRIQHPNPSIIELEILLRKNRYYRKLALGMLVQCVLIGIISGMLWSGDDAWKLRLTRMVAARLFLFLSLLSLIAGIRAACMASFFSRVVYEHEYSDAESERQKQKSMDA